LPLAQTDCDHTTTGARNADLAPFIDRIANKYGADRIWRAAVYESHVPERAVAYVSPLATALTPVLTKTDAKTDSPAWDPEKPRPVRLFDKPQPVEAFAVAPDDPPSFFKWQGRIHNILRAEGPERIGSEWWRKPWAEQAGEEGVDRVRDYYRVEDEDGARFWVFRTGLYGHERKTRWYLHGLFG
jgi:protein ImuB